MKQTLPFACSTPSCQIEIKGESAQKFTGPAIKHIERQKEITVEYTYQEQTKIQKIPGDIRWSEGILGNSALILLGGPVLALLGISVDFYTGGIYELKTPKVVSFANAKATQPKVIAIAPIEAENVFVSDEAVAILKDQLKKDYPQAEILVPELFYEEFDKNNWSYKSKPKDRDKYYAVIKKLNTSFIAEARVKSNSKGKATITYQVNDVMRDQLLLDHFFEYTTQVKKNDATTTLRSVLFELVPNSIETGVGKSNTVGAAFQNKSIDDSYRSTNYYVGSKYYGHSQDEYSLSLTRLDNNFGKKFKSIFKMSGSLNFSLKEFAIKQEERSINYSTMSSDFGKTLESTSNVSDVSFYSLGYGIGPEFGLMGALGYVYMNLHYNLEYVYANIKKTDQHISEVQFPISFNLGYTLGLGENLHMSIKTGIKSLSSNITDQLFHGVSAQGTEVNGYLYETKTMLVLTYKIPELRSDLDRYAKSALNN